MRARTTERKNTDSWILPGKSPHSSLGATEVRQSFPVSKGLQTKRIEKSRLIVGACEAPLLIDAVANARPAPLETPWTNTA